MQLLGGEPQRAVATDANPHAARVVPRTAADQLGDVIGVDKPEVAELHAGMAVYQNVARLQDNNVR